MLKLYLRKVFREDVVQVVNSTMRVLEYAKSGNSQPPRQEIPYLEIGIALVVRSIQHPFHETIGIASLYIGLSQERIQSAGEVDPFETRGDHGLWLSARSIDNRDLG